MSKKNQSYHHGNFSSNHSQHNHTQNITSKQLPQTNGQIQSTSTNPHGIFLTHEQKIQATYNFQSLFRKKSHIYNMHKNKKKMMSKNQKSNEQKSDDPEKQSKNVKKGHWTMEQNRKYHWFLELHNKHFIMKHLRRTDKIFKTMSAFIGTREAEQCRSHHQKMQKKYKNFYQIIVKLRMQYYGTCGTEAVRVDLQENGFSKEKKGDLIEEKVLKQMENVRGSDGSDEESDKEDQYDGDERKIEEEGGDGIGEFEVFENGGHENLHEDQESKEKDGHLFFGENYEKQLNYKLY